MKKPLLSRLHFNRKALVSLMAVLFGLIAGALFILCIGHNPFTGYKFLFQGGLMNIERIGNSLAMATPLILTGLSLAFASRTGLFNIGAAGQMLFGGFMTTVFALLNPALPRVILLPAVILIGMLSGAVWAGIPGFLKAKFNCNEVVITIMMNWIAYWIVAYVIPNYFPESLHVKTISQRVPDAASLRTGWLTELFNGSYLNIGIFLALLAAVAVSFILNRTVMGYELKAVGHNRMAAEYAGIGVSRNIVLAMVIAGALAGLAGVTYYCGYSVNMQINVLPSQGFDGIAISLLGLGTPVGVIVSAFFFGIMQAGKNFMSSNTAIPPEIADTIIATIIYFAAAGVILDRALTFFSNRGRRLRKPREKQPEATLTKGGAE